MQIPLSFKRMFLAPGKTFAVPTVAGSRVRVVDGLVWATTSSSPEDVWLGAGDEHANDGDTRLGDAQAGLPKAGTGGVEPALCIDRIGGTPL